VESWPGNARSCDHWRPVQENVSGAWLRRWFVDGEIDATWMVFSWWNWWWLIWLICDVEGFWRGLWLAWLCLEPSSHLVNEVRIFHCAVVMCGFLGPTERSRLPPIIIFKYDLGSAWQALQKGAVGRGLVGFERCFSPSGHESACPFSHIFAGFPALVLMIWADMNLQ
jgi:hypothetical protein